MENIREHIYLAALLHDIGKFYQRADSGSVNSSKYLSSSIKNLEGIILPSFKGVTTHKHALWTAQFIADHETVFKSLVGVSSLNLQNENNLMNIAAGHHLPYSQQSTLGRIIKEADSLSSGMDRDTEIAIRDAQDEAETNWDAFKKKRMTSILETIHLTQQELEERNEWYHLPVEKLTLHEDYFPRRSFETTPDYAKQWNEFVRDFKFIQANTYEAFSETLLNLLFRYTVTIPASTINFSDVSLYDHSKMTAALAVCLYDAQQENDTNEKPFLLIGADFSGIQTYIYQIISKYAAKNLKGRSFYLRILSDAVVKFLLRELNLFRSNVIYNSGGSFYIIAPNTQFVKDRLKQAIETIETNMFNTHGNVLFLAVDAVEVSKDALLNKSGENLSEVWTQLFEKRDQKKNHKFSKLITTDYDRFFKPFEFGIEIDSITGEGIGKNEKSKKLSDVGLVKPLTYQQVEMGKQLRESELLVITYDEIAAWKSKNPIEPIGLGVYFYLIKKKDLSLLKNNPNDFMTIVTLNGEDGNCDFMYAGEQNDWIVKGVNNVYGLEFYGGNLFDGKTFDEFCNKDNDDAFRRLGVLRMDVDNLGHIFQAGILPNRVTLSRYAALSRSFDYFFSGYINVIQQEIAPDSSFIIYSGGDDLFVVGSWDETIKMAKRIRYDFRKFTCHNPSFSVSGGVAIVPPKFPIMKGAEESGIEEHLAKTHRAGDADKNSISFMDTPLNWDKEYPIVEQLKDNLVSLITNGVIPKSFISKVLQHTANANINEHKINHLKTFWIVSYDMSRMAARIKDRDARMVIDNFKNEVCSTGNKLNSVAIKTNYHAMELWAMASRWAELEIRTNK